MTEFDRGQFEGQVLARLSIIEDTLVHIRTGMRQRMDGYDEKLHRLELDQTRVKTTGSIGIFIMGVVVPLIGRLWK